MSGEGDVLHADKGCKDNKKRKI